ncbi:hypothetical protein HanHA300_Chr13g0490161 [Helianthus annuus]|nr:hypothetical protein HanHA300_Chr13g0490161 [Helianthus annuus]KAJ0498407.1 hypothetical protein HanHA89_Chr13g0522271 [Helianthus annuus]KAJ0664418.1 hypothetical protein HanLR1_Chr13g0492211 [Helianthus annuus]KAJ0671877.1 hypothetical protein HanOQP8_Chr13g0490651 [Helianthus annuus]
MTRFKAIEWLESVVRPLEIPKQPSNFLIGQSFMFPTTNGCSIVKTSGELGTTGSCGGCVTEDQKTCDMLADLQIKTKNEIAWKKARERDILLSVNCNV